MANEVNDEFDECDEGSPNLMLYRFGTIDGSPVYPSSRSGGILKSPLGKDWST
jgi:hypothetical protein